MQSEVQLSYTSLPYLPAVAAVGFSTCLAAEAAALVTLTLGAGWAAVCNTARQINPRDSKFNKELHSSNNWKFTFCRNQKNAPAIINCMGLPEWTGLGVLVSSVHSLALAPRQCTQGSWLEVVLLSSSIKVPVCLMPCTKLRNASHCSLHSESRPSMFYTWSFLEQHLCHGYLHSWKLKQTIGVTKWCPGLYTEDFQGTI